MKKSIQAWCDENDLDPSGVEVALVAVTLAYDALAVYLWFLLMTHLPHMHWFFALLFMGAFPFLYAFGMLFVAMFTCKVVTGEDIPPPYVPKKYRADEFSLV